MQDFGKLVLTLPSGQEQEFALAKADVNLGRATINDVVLLDAKVSRSHARLECGHAGGTIFDLGSANGTRVNGLRVERAALVPGDVIALGDSVLRYERAALRVEPEVTRLDSEGDLEAALARATLSMTLNDTRPPRLAVYTPGKTWEAAFASDALTIGRHAPSDIVLDHPKVSRHHARVERRGEEFVIRDLQSTNGTWLGEQRIAEHKLADGDTIRIGNAQLVFKRGFAPEELTFLGTPTSEGEPTRRPVVVVPGFMGSELWRGSERVWFNARNLFTRPELLRPDEPLEARRLVGEAVIVPNLIKLEQYSRLVDYLEEGLGYERGKNLLEFPYDWRQDLRITARRLASAIDAWQAGSAEARGALTIIAHSMGCLVSRYYVERLGGKARVSRLILMGGPLAGAPRAVEVCASGCQASLLGRLAQGFHRVVASFPSFYTLLPAYPCIYDATGRPIDPYRDYSWAPAECRAHIASARRFRQELGTVSSVPAVSVFGYGLKTLVRITVERRTSDGWQGIRLIAEDRGDSTVPEESALLKGAEIHPVLQHHGALYADNDVKMRLKRELISK